MGRERGGNGGQGAVKVNELAMTARATFEAHVTGLAAQVRVVVDRVRCAIAVRVARALGAVGTLRREAEGQGTTEYAILVGVLVVIAIAAILLFRGKIQELWESIQSSINNL